MDSSSEINNCREIIPYVSPVNNIRMAAQENHTVDINDSVLLPSNVSSHPRENGLETSNESELTPYQLAGRERGLISAEVIALSTVSFSIVPLAGETNIYTVKLNKGEDLVDPFRLNQKYQDILNGWTCEKRRRPNGQCDKVYHHMRKSSICRSLMEVCRYILDGYEKVQVQVDCETNMVKEIKIGSPKRPSKKRKKESSNSEDTTTEQKQNNGELYLGNEVTLMCEMMELKETSEFVEVDKVEEGENKVFVHLNKSNELDSEFSKSVENMEQVLISQSLEITNNENAYMEKGLPYEDNYGEKERIANLASNVEFVTPADFTLETGENDKEGVCITTNFSLPEVAPPMKIDSAKEGNKTTLEDSHGKEDHRISHDNIFTNMENCDLFSPKEGLDDLFLLYGIENDDFGDAYTPNIKDL